MHPALTLYHNGSQAAIASSTDLALEPGRLGRAWLPTWPDLARAWLCRIPTGLDRGQSLPDSAGRDSLPDPAGLALASSLASSLVPGLEPWSRAQTRALEPVSSESVPLDKAEPPWYKEVSTH